MASLHGKRDFVALVAEQMVSGMDRALRYWLGRIEIEVLDRSLTAGERLDAIEQILTEYKALAMPSPEGDTTGLPIDAAASSPQRARARNGK